VIASLSLVLMSVLLHFNRRIGAGGLRKHEYSYGSSRPPKSCTLDRDGNHDSRRLTNLKAETLDQINAPGDAEACRTSEQLVLIALPGFGPKLALGAPAADSDFETASPHGSPGKAGRRRLARLTLGVSSYSGPSRLMAAVSTGRGCRAAS